jgi:hypothetical protein
VTAKPTLPPIPPPPSVQPALSECGLALVPVERLERFLEALARLDGRHGEVDGRHGEVAG